MFFEGIDNKDNKDKPLSLIEKSIIIAGSALFKIVLWKLRRAKTYGDLSALGSFIETKLDDMENKFPDAITTDENAKGVVQEFEKAGRELENN